MNYLVSFTPCVFCDNRKTNSSCRFPLRLPSTLGCFSNDDSSRTFAGLAIKEESDVADTLEVVTDEV